MRVGWALLAAAASALVAAPASLAATPPRAEVEVVLVSITLRTSHTDRSPKGASRGDTIHVYDRLVNVASQFGKEIGARVGTDKGTFTYTSETAARYDGWCSLPGGTLILHGPVRMASGGVEVIPVVGGTGKYRGANGALRIGAGQHVVRNTYEFTVTPPRTA